MGARRERLSSLVLFTNAKCLPAAAKGGPDQNQEPGTSPGSPTWMAENQGLGLPSAASQAHERGAGSAEQPRSKPAVCMGCRCSTISAPTS